MAWGDDRYRELRAARRTLADEHGDRRARPARARRSSTLEPETSIPLDDFGAVVFAGGFRPDYRSWFHVPGAFDDLGFPIHEDGASTAAPGLYFVGVHFLRKRKSSMLLRRRRGRAAIVAGLIAAARATA